MTTPPFSERNGYKKSNQEVILEDAPRWMRESFDQFVMPALVGKSMPLVYHDIVNRLLLKKRIAANSLERATFLERYLYNCQWFEFYDLIEFFWQALNKKHPNTKVYVESLGNVRHCDAYVHLVNAFLSEVNSGWRMNQHGQIRRQSDKDLDNQIESVEPLLIDEFSVAMLHYSKAKRFLNQAPIDPENCIKEIVSALESVGRVIFPKAKTAGDVVDELKKSKLIPNHLITVIDKFWAYASSEPAVRHGHPVSSRVAIDDAEYALHVGSATIRYLVAAHKRSTSE